MNDQLVSDLADLRPSDTVREFVDTLIGARGAISDRQAGYVSLRPDVDAGRAVYVHRARVSIAVDPLKAQAAAATLPGAILDRDTPATTFVILDDDALGAAPTAAVKLAIRALDWRATGPRVGQRSDTSSDHAPQPTCTTHNLALPATGICDYCDV